MKTNHQNSNTGLKNQSEQLNTNPTHTPETPNTPTADTSDKKDNRLPIDSEARKKNRTLPTPKVLNLLHTQLPAAYRLAEVVGGRPDSGWVWVRFTEPPAAEIRQQLAQLGFHWNRERQAWQHPCGQFRLSSSGDPREKYSSYYPARVRRHPQTVEATA